MISDGTKKITVRSLSKELYVDEMPLNWYEFRIDNSKRKIVRKSFRIINREHKINSYPEE
jgi:hypothetical protein